MSKGRRPDRVVVVVGTGTDIGKTWVGARLLSELGAAGVTVAARKPAQSFEPSDDPERRDAAVLGAASNEPPESVCPPHRWYEVPLAPTMAAEALGRPGFSTDDLCAELVWPEPSVDVGLVETAGGIRSPLAGDGDCLAFCRALRPDVVLLVADAGLGTINAVRLGFDALESLSVPVVVVLNRFDDSVDVHVRNRDWLRADGLDVLTVPGDESKLVESVAPARRAPNRLLS